MNNQLIISLTNAIVICQYCFLLQSYNFTDVTEGNPVSAISLQPNMIWHLIVIDFLLISVAPNPKIWYWGAIQLLGFGVGSQLNSSKPNQGSKSSLMFWFSPIT
jgi:hypothetical protein